MADIQTYIQRLVESNPLREPPLRSIVQSLQLPQGSRGLDAGCGVGLQAVLLAEAVGPGGHVTGLDLLPELLRYAEGVVHERGLAERISWRAGDVAELPFDDDTFDRAWSVDCVGYPAGDPAARTAGTRACGETRRHRGSPGLVGANPAAGVSAGRSQAECKLFGVCALCRRLAATGTVPARLHWLQEVGMEDVEGRTFVGDVQAPLSAGIRARADFAVFHAVGRATVLQRRRRTGSSTSVCAGRSPLTLF